MHSNPDRLDAKRFFSDAGQKCRSLGLYSRIQGVGRTHGPKCTKKLLATTASARVEVRYVYRHYCLCQKCFKSDRLTLYGHIKTGQVYSNTVIGTLAVDGWTVTFGTSRKGLGGLRPRPVTSSLYQLLTAHPSTASVPTSYYSM